MKKMFVFFLMLLGFNNIYGQTIEIFNVNAEGFPLVKAKIFASVVNGGQDTDLSPSNIMLTENGLERKITKVTCPSPKQPVPISSVLTIDVSGSMKNGGFKIAKTALSAWVRELNLMVDECAITSFDNYNYLNQDFTTDSNKLLIAIDSLKPKGSTDYDYALINKMSGALVVSKAGQYKKVIILMTDGLPEKEPQVTRIIATAKQQGCEIYSVVIGMSCPQSLKDISEQTGGLWFDNVYTPDEAQSIYSKILRIARGLEPCEIEWESDFGCQLRLTNVRVYQATYMGQTYYQPPEISLAKLELTPNFIYFGGVQPGKIKDTTVILKAINGDFRISDIKVSLGPKVYSLRNVTFPINLKQGDSEILDIRYEPQDSSIYFTSFTIETDVCRRTLNMIGGFGGHALPENPLKLTMPNGGELFVIGSDTLITWEGVYESDTVSLEYSIDNGKTWTFITDTATGLKYIWKNIPPPTSNECLIKVKLIKKELIADATPFLEWQRTYGGNLGDGAKSIQQTSDSGYIVTGYRQTLDYNWTTDVFLYKLDKSGNVEWEQNYGGVYQDAGYSVQQTKDGGYILAGERNNDNGINLPAGWWVAKLNNVGIIEWSQLYNGWMAKSIQQTKDGGYIVAGWSAKKGIGISILKLDSQGKTEWEHSNKADSLCNFNSVIQTKDGGYVAVGVVKHNFNPIDVSDYYIVKYNSDGNKIWEQIYGGDKQDIGYSILQTREGGFIVTGETFSDNRDVYENKGKSDYWLLKLNPQGIIDWRKNIGGSGEEGTHDYYNTSSIIQTSDGGYIFTGTTNSVDGDVSENKGYQDLWVVRLDATGKVNWEKTYGGSTVDFAEQVQQTNDGGFVIAGATFSNNGDLIENLGMSDIWLLKFGLKLPILPEDVSDAVFSIVAPEPVSKNIDMKKCIVGMSKDSVIDNFISNIGSYKFRVDSIYLRGFDSKAFSLVSGLPKYSLEPGESKNTEFRFIPLREGKHFAEIVIISQADTLIQTIEGEGIAPQIQVLSKNIDFGLVNMGKSKDTLQAMTIKNIGTAPITITNTKHNKPNDYDFSTISGGGSFTLNPGDTAKLDLRFTPSFIGRTSGTLEFHYNDIGSPAIVMLFGEGIKQTPGIRATLPQFIDLICDNSTATTLEIKSIGGDTLRIKALNITGADKADFSINEVLPINLAPDSSKTISIGFKTNVPCIKTAALEIKSNADPDSVLMIPLTARKDSVALVPNPTLIDLGTLFPNQTKDSSVVISNLGTIKADGKVTFTSNLTCANPTFAIDSGGVYILDFTFTGIPAEGIINEKITVWDEVCKYFRDVLITGKVVSPHLFGFSAIQCKSYSNEYKLTLNNNTSNRLKILSILFDKNPQFFEIDPSLVFPITIEPFTTDYKIKVKYQDNTVQKFATAVNCLTDNEFIPILTDSIYLETVEYKRTSSGLINDTIHNASNPFAVSYDSASQYGKNKFTYSIKVNESAQTMDYLTELSDLEVIINYNRNVLGADFDTQIGNVKVRLSDDTKDYYSITSAKETKIDELNTQIIVNLENTGTPIASKDAYKLLEIDFTAYLGKEGLSNEQNSNKSRSAVISHSINSSDKCISYESANNAEVTIDKLCVDEIRSIKITDNPSDHFYLSDVIPQPVGSMDATIEYGLGFECQITLTIYDISGAIVLTPVNEIQKAGTHKQAISRKSLSAGAYFIEMKAGQFKETKKMIVE